MRFRFACFGWGAICAAAVVVLSGMPAWAELYQYTDDQGHTHYVESINQIPENYRDQVRSIDGKDVPAFQAQGASPKPPPAAAASAATDKEGRGEAYWCGRKKTLDAGIADLEAQKQKIESTGAFDISQPQGVAALQAVQADLQQVTKDLKAARKEREGLSEEARKAGALPGWLRDSCKDGASGPEGTGSPEDRRRELEKRIAEEEKKIISPGENYDPVLAARNAEIQANIDQMKSELEGLGQEGSKPGGTPPKRSPGTRPSGAR